MGFVRGSKKPKFGWLIGGNMWSEMQWNKWPSDRVTLLLKNAILVSLNNKRLLASCTRLLLLKESLTSGDSHTFFQKKHSALRKKQKDIPSPGIEPGPCRWERQILTTGPTRSWRALIGSSLCEDNLNTLYINLLTIHALMEFNALKERVEHANMECYPAHKKKISFRDRS